MSAADIIVRLKIVLDDAEPPIWRAVELPARTGLKELHHIIQAAMGWDDEHLYSFQIGRQKIGGREWRQAVRLPLRHGRQLAAHTTR